MLFRVVVAVDRASEEKRLRRVLSQPDVLVSSFKPGKRLLEKLSGRNVDLIVVERGALGEAPAGMVTLLKQLPDKPAVAVVSDTEEREQEGELLAAGSEAILYTGVSVRVLREMIAGILERRRSVIEGQFAWTIDLQEPRLADFASSSAAMRRFMQVVDRVVVSDVPLLLLGETGVGKERLARAIHAESSRSAGPFIAVNCGALPETLLESELFGHEEGAFTGASRSRRGWFELAHGGTVFLDEIGDMPVHLQVKLLRILQEHEVQRVGSERTVTVDVRVMAATNRDLESDVAARQFRRDLYYRLSVVALTVPPLRERDEDIPLLVNSYIHHFQSRIGRDVRGIRSDALEALQRYTWPGNVRELMNVIERAMLLCSGEEITLDDLPGSVSETVRSEKEPMGVLTGSDMESAFPEEWLEQPWREVREQVVERLERAYLSGLLARTRGRVGKTAKLAGMRARSLFEKMKRLGLRKEDFRSPGETDDE